MNSPINAVYSDAALKRATNNANIQRYRNELSVAINDNVTQIDELERHNRERNTYKQQLEQRLLDVNHEITQTTTIVTH